MHRSHLATQSTYPRLGFLQHSLARLIAPFLLMVGLTVIWIPATAHAATVLNVPAAYPTVRAALVAAVDGDTVLVAPGHYFGDFTVHAGVTVRSEAGPAVTSIQLWHNDGVTVRGGILEGFTFLMSDNSWLGIRSPGGTIRHNILANSTPAQIKTSNAGIYVADDDTTGVIDGNLIHGLMCQPTSSVDTAMIRLNSGSAEITNNLMVGNSCIGIGLKSTVTEGTVTVANNTVVGATRGIAIEAGGSGANKVFRNNIISGGDTGFELAGTPNPTWTNNLVHGNATQFVGMADPTGTDGNLASDPAFVGAGPSPYRLMAASPAVDAGTSTDAPPTDFFGTGRPIDGDGDLTATVDIGAYEFGGAVGSITGTVTSRPTGSGVPDVCAMAFSAGGTAYGTHTSSDGSYTIEVAADSYDVQFTDCLLGAYLGKWYDDVADRGLATGVVVAADAAVGGIDAALDIGVACNGQLGTIVGTLGSDTITGSDEADVILGMGGDDTIDALLGDDIVCGNDGNDLIRVHGGADYVEGGLGNDEIIGGGGADHLLGGEGHDTIEGGSGSDYINGEVHDDTIDGGAGKDTLDGDWGDDTIVGGTHKDTIRGGYGNDIIKGEGGHDDLGGGPGDDTIRGGGGNDEIAGASGDDVLFGGSGSDTISGGGDDDTLEGGSGDDVMDGQNGVDIVDFSSASQEMTVDLAVSSVEGEGADTIANIEGVVGSEFDDVLRGDDDDNLLYGGGGNDKLFGNRGRDRLYGGAGDDRFLDGNGDDYNFGNGGADVFISQPGNDYISGDAGYDTVSYADAPRGITKDRIGPAKGHGRDTIGVDKIIGSDFDDNINSSSDMYGRGGNDILYSFGNRGTVIQGGSGDDEIHGGEVREAIFGGSGNDTIRAGAGKDEIEGGSGNDDIRAGGGDDIVDGGTGDDKIIGGAGDDVLFGGEGNDDLNGDVEDDLLVGGAGNDILDGSHGDDVLAGEAGHDSLIGGTGADTASYAFADGVKVSLTGGWATGDGNDTLSSMEWLVGSEGNDVLTGSSVPNAIDARGGNDTLNGLDSSDLLLGKAGDDTLNGGNHDDFLYGDEGTDVLNGGSGSDECHDGETHTSCETIGAAPAAIWSADRIQSFGEWLTAAIGHQAATRVLQHFVAA